jgi:hypothetical protein
MRYLLVTGDLRRFAPEPKVRLVPVDPDSELSRALLESVWLQVC